MNLAHLGYSVAEADSVESADEALHAATESFDAIVLDVNLPDQTGWDVLRHLRDAHALRIVPPSSCRRRCGRCSAGLMNFGPMPSSSSPSPSSRLYACWNACWGPMRVSPCPYSHGRVLAIARLVGADRYRRPRASCA